MAHVSKGERITSGMYDEGYFLSEACPGAQVLEAGGLPLTEVQALLLTMAAIGAEDRVLDFGAGRGEVTLRAATAAGLAIGVDYSAGALAHTRRMRSLCEPAAAARSRFVRAGAGPLPVRSASIDIVLMLDVIEHLYPDEVAETLAEFYRILRPGGRLLLHTPNRLDYDIAWPYWGYFVSAAARLLRGRRPAIPRNKRIEAELRFHINEHSPRQLRKSLRAAGFEDIRVVPFTLFYCSPWTLRGLYTRVGQYLRPLSLVPPLSHVFNHSIVGVARKHRS